MNTCTSVATGARLARLMAFALLLPLSAFAEEIKLQVSFAHVPGQEELDRGQIDAAIRILEQRAASGIDLLENETSTLCAAYIMAADYESATPVCNDAVRRDDSEMAYNNRGVLRAHLGDFAGSLRDFEKIRWTASEQDAFLAQALKLHPRTAASVNYELLNGLKAKAQARRARIIANGNLSGARVESIRP